MCTDIEGYTALIQQNEGKAQSDNHEQTVYIPEPVLSSNVCIPPPRPNIVLRSSLAELGEARKIKPVIDRSYSFGDISEAFQYDEDDLALGKVVITIYSGI